MVSLAASLVTSLAAERRGAWYCCDVPGPSHHSMATQQNGCNLLASWLLSRVLKWHATNNRLAVYNNSSVPACVMRGRNAAMEEEGCCDVVTCIVTSLRRYVVETVTWQGGRRAAVDASTLTADGELGSNAQQSDRHKLCNMYCDVGYVTL